MSLGQTVYARRFYFADAAALELLEREAHGRQLTPLSSRMTDALRDLGKGLAVTVEAFIVARRRSPWKPFTEDP